MDKSLYTEDSIQKLDPLSFTRLRPDTYLGSNEDSTQLVREIVTNAYDEFLAGNCTEIWVDYNQEKNEITVQDNGQGILPNVEKEDGRTVLEMVYGDINVSGKYDKSESAVYKVSTGAFGIGASLTNFLSHYLIATTVRDGKSEEVCFEEGKFKDRYLSKRYVDGHGVTVKFQPSEEFFRDARPNLNKLDEEFFNMSCICAGLTIHFNGKDYYHPQGIKELLNKRVGETASLIQTPFLFEKKNDNQYLNFALDYTTESSSSIDCFCNYSIIEAGTPVTAVKTCITRVLNSWAREQGLLKEKDKNLDGNSVQEGMKIIFNLASPNIRYDSQTKVRVTSTEDNNFITSVLGANLEIWLDSNPQDGKTIIEKALLARKAAEAAKKAREAVKNQSEKKEKVFKLPTKLTDCWSKNRQECEICLCEGLSAASSLVAARDSKFQSVYGVRGKMLSVLKTTPARILANQEINNLIQALGLDCDTKTAKLTYNKSKLRYGKIITICDADEDGKAITNLMLNIFWYLCPELILNGHVYCAIPPLFKVTTKKNEYIYLRGAAELEEYKKTSPNSIKTIGRMKGIGEMDPEEVAETLLSPETRNIIQLTVNDSKQVDKMFDDLYGKNVQPRVDYILEHSEEADFE